MARFSLFVALFLGVQVFLHAQSPTSDTTDLELVVFTLPADNVKDGFYRVETEEDYQKLQRTLNMPREGASPSYDYPKINFKKYILMGGTFKLNNCERVTLEERLYELRSQQKIVYKLYLVQFGQCAEAVMIKRWILVKKKKGYTYQFDNRIVEMQGSKL